MYLGYHHVLMIFLCVSVLFSSILIAGCTSEQLKNVYLVSLSTTVLSQSSSVTETPAEASALFASLAGNSTSLEVRLCFKGICARLGSGSWACSASKDALRTTFISSSHSTPNEEVDPLGLLVLAHRARTEVVFDGIIYITIAFCVIGFAVLASFPGRHKEEGPDDEEQDVKPFPLKWMSYGAMACASLAAILSFVAAFWQHLSSSTVVTMAEALTYGVVGGRVGTVAMVLGWGCAGFTALTFLGLLIMILTLRALDRITA